MTAVAVDGSRAFAGIGQHLAILDVADPSTPEFLGESPGLGETLQDIAVVEDTAYVALEGRGLIVLDVSVPDSVSQVGQHGPGATRVAVRDSVAFVLHPWEGVEILDVSQPTSPSTIALCPIGGASREMAVVGGLMFVVNSEWDGVHYTGGLTIFDIVDRTQLLQVSFYAIPYADGLALAENVAYVSSFWGITAFDVSQPALPVELGHLAIWEVSQIAVDGRWLYAAAHDQLFIVDVADPALPVTMARYDLGGATARMALRHPTSYIVSQSELHILDSSDPAHPRVVGEYASVIGGGRLTMDGTRVYVPQRRNGIAIIDASTANQPMVLGTYDSGSFYAQEVAVAGSLVYVAGLADGLRILDVSDPGIISQVGSLQVRGPESVLPVTDVEVVGRYAYLSVGSSGLHIVDVSDPSHPLEIGACPTGGSPGQVAVSGGYAYIASWDLGLEVIDVRDRTAPRKVAALPSSSMTFGVVVKGTHAYVADFKGGLRVVDVSVPETPREVATVAGSVWNVAMRGDYVVTTGYDISVVDITEPTAPKVVASHRTTEKIDSVLLGQGQVLYAVSELNGLQTFWYAPTTSVDVPIEGDSYLHSEWDRTEYMFPQGTFASPARATHSPRRPGTSPPPGLLGIGHSFEITAVDVASAMPIEPVQPYQIEVSYRPAEKGAAIASRLALFRWSDMHWEAEPTSQVDWATRKVTATADRLGLWAVFGETRRTYLPLVR